MSASRASGHAVLPSELRRHVPGAGGPASRSAGPPIPRGHVAVHESGHAVTMRALGWPFDFVTLADPPRVQPLPGATGPPTIGMQWLNGAAGVIADFQSRGLSMPDGAVLGLLLGSADGTFEVLDAAGAVAVRPSRALPVGPGGDLESMAAVMREDAWPWPVILEVWRACELFVSRCRPAISAVAAALLDRGELSYAEVSGLVAGAMPGPPPVPAWIAWTPGHWQRCVDAARLAG